MLTRFDIEELVIANTTREIRNLLELLHRAAALPVGEVGGRQSEPRNRLLAGFFCFAGISHGLIEDASRSLDPPFREKNRAERAPELSTKQQHPPLFSRSQPVFEQGTRAGQFPLLPIHQRKAQSRTHD